MTSLKSKYTPNNLFYWSSTNNVLNSYSLGSYKIRFHSHTVNISVGKYTLIYRLSLPEGVDYGASTLTHNTVVPEPSFRVYGLPYSPQNTQTGQIISETDRVRQPELMDNIFRDQK